MIYDLIWRWFLGNGVYLSGFFDRVYLFLSLKIKGSHSYRWIYLCSLNQFAVTLGRSRSL